MKNYIIALPGMVLGFCLIVFSPKCEAGMYEDGLCPQVAAIDSADSVVFDMSNIIIAGSQISIPVYINADDPVYAVDFSLRFNSAALVYDTITLSPAGAILLAVSYLNPNDSIIRFTSSAMVTVSNQTVLAYIHFERIAGQPLSAGDLFNLKGYLNGDPCSENVIPPLSAGIQQSLPDFDVQVYPNPVSDYLNIRCNEPMLLEFFDSQGKSVLLKSRISAGAENRVDVSQLPKGNSILRLQPHGRPAISKVLIVE